VDSPARVAVVIPCHNDGRLVLDALGSIAEDEPLEIVVVDDGSTDPDTLAVLADIERAGTRVVHQENTGLSGARMRGVHETSAPYVYPLDADDLAEPGSLARLADALDRDPGAGAAWGDERVFGDVEIVKRSARELDPWRITYLNEVPTSALLRRDALLEAGGWQLQGGYEDWDLCLALAQAGWRGVFVPGTITRHYRQHGPRMLGGSIARHDELVAAMRRRNGALYANRSAARRRSDAPLRLKLLFPAIDRLPFLSGYGRQRLVHLTADPGRVLRASLKRRFAKD